VWCLASFWIPVSESLFLDICNLKIYSPTQPVCWYPLNRLSMTVTDIVTVPVKPGTNVLDVDTPEAEAFADSWRILGRQVGFVEAWYGYKIENPNELQLFISRYFSPAIHCHMLTRSYDRLEKHRGACDLSRF